MRRAKLLLPMALLAACHDSDGSDAVNADALVTDLLLNQTNESGEPLEIDGANLVFPADDTAFDDVLPPDTGAVVEQ